MNKVNRGIKSYPICEAFQKASDTAMRQDMQWEEDFHEMVKENKITKTAISHSASKLWNNIPRMVRKALSL